MLSIQQAPQKASPVTLFIGSIALGITLCSSALQANEIAKIGSTLNKKVEINIADIPAEVLTVIKRDQPDFTVKEAEKEFKHGKVYFDVEGEKSDGSEIEFDLLLVNNEWKIMEVQRDVTLQECPKAVIAAYHSNVDSKPQRIIESKQNTGEVIYEFYSRFKNGSEVKHEIKFWQGKAEILDVEWEH